MKFLTLEQFTEMWKLQDELNTVTSGPNWKELNQNWNLAIKSEVMEFFDYIGWKWWKEPDAKKKPSDMQARLELVDIWHFLLSSIEEKANGLYSTETAYKELEHHLYLQGTPAPAVACLEELDTSRVSNWDKVFYLSLVVEACEWTWDELYKAYIGKVALNNFRQANGYKEGTYQKIWKETYTNNGDVRNQYEDNWFLEGVMKNLEQVGQLTYTNVYENLQIVYDRRDVI